ncbi:RAD52 motif-containing protein 1 isoform X5 [Lagopus muta]|uniref:RAD52 motif-containing protein 1 isoform X5 n=1 Tax=Lagopus muta TaxID=64668 RepID=UPI0020A179FA|nr:RAD52 motif-containing protein 1 isoform X5 [Lagopus muta]
MKLLKCVTELQQSPQKARGQREGAGQPLGTHGCSTRCTFFPWFVCCLCFCVGLLFCLLVCLFPKHALFSVFSKFGLLYSVRAHSNAAVAGPGCYAIIKFYSAADASRAQQACNGQKLFQNSPMKVCVCTKQKGFQQQVLALNSNKCQELANHYLGFNGWCSRIITAVIFINLLFHQRRSSAVCYSCRKSSEARSRQSFVQRLSEDSPRGFSFHSVQSEPFGFLQRSSSITQCSNHPCSCPLYLVINVTKPSAASFLHSGITAVMK